MMGFPDIEPESGGDDSGGGSRISLATDLWDPASSAFDQAAIGDVKYRLQSLINAVHEYRSTLEADGPTLGLVQSNLSVSIPDEWAQSPGSPVHYLRIAEGYLLAAQLGTVCRDQFPPAPRFHRPPPGEQWCCTHTPEPHCEPR
jgi:hypothetical protein